MSAFKRHFSIVNEMCNDNDRFLVIDGALPRDEAAIRFSVHLNRGAEIHLTNSQDGLIKAEELREDYVRFGYWTAGTDDPHLCWHFNGYGPAKGACKVWLYTMKAEDY